MCTTCGCSDDLNNVLSAARDAPAPALRHHGEPGSAVGHTIPLAIDVLAANDRIAALNRTWLESRGITALNVMSSPGSGKTTILEATINALGSERRLYVIEGDQETARDTIRIRNAGAPAVQINTGTGCHLDSRMIDDALRKLQPEQDSIIFIENVGNLVCPALFDLGEQARVVVASVTEGDEKPLKYPYIFRSADLILLNKIDLLAHVNFEVKRFLEYALSLNPRVAVLPVSATKGEGLEQWYCWMKGVGKQKTNSA